MQVKQVLWELDCIGFSSSKCVRRVNKPRGNQCLRVFRNDMHINVCHFTHAYNNSSAIYVEVPGNCTFRVNMIRYIMKDFTHCKLIFWFTLRVHQFGEY